MPDTGTTKLLALDLLFMYYRDMTGQPRMEGKDGSRIGQ